MEDVILLDSTFIKTLIPRLVPDSPSLSPWVGQRNPPLVVSLQQMCQTELTLGLFCDFPSLGEG